MLSVTEYVTNYNTSYFEYLQDGIGSKSSSKSPHMDEGDWYTLVDFWITSLQPVFTENPLMWAVALCLPDMLSSAQLFDEQLTFITLPPLQVTSEIDNSSIASSSTSSWYYNERYTCTKFKLWKPSFNKIAAHAIYLHINCHLQLLLNIKKLRNQ